MCLCVRVCVRMFTYSIIEKLEYVIKEYGMKINVGNTLQKLIRLKTWMSCQGKGKNKLISTDTVLEKCAK